MSKTRKLVVNLGSSKGGLSTVGYTIYNEAGGTHKARSTSGVTELGTSTGIYKATVTLDDAFDGFIVWDSGDATIRYAVEPTLGQLNSIQDETDHIRIIWNSLRNQGDLYAQLLKALDKMKGVKAKEYDKELATITALIKEQDIPTLKDIEKSLHIPAPIVNIPEVKIPNYMGKFVEIIQSLRSLFSEVKKIPQEQKDFGLKQSTQSLQSEIDKLNKTVEGLQTQLKELQDNISTTVKPAKLLQEIFNILEQSKDLKQLSDEYKKKTDGLNYMGLR
jgi:chromosome segregation ATPase